MNDGQLNKTTRHKMDVTEMKMLRGMSEYILKDRIKIEFVMITLVKELG